LYYLLNIESAVKHQSVMNRLCLCSHLHSPLYRCYWFCIFNAPRHLIWVIWSSVCSYAVKNLLLLLTCPIGIMLSLPQMSSCGLAAGGLYPCFSIILSLHIHSVYTQQFSSNFAREREYLW